MSKKIQDKVVEYYTDKLRAYGATSQGVDWNGPESQFLRFAQLARVLEKKSDVSILDFGCGYGSLISYLEELELKRYSYYGFDLSVEMLEEAKKKYEGDHINFSDKLASIPNVDYTVASGLFNVRLEEEFGDWKRYIEDCLIQMDEKSQKGFAFNILTSYSDEEFKKDYLFYADPMEYFNLCKRKFSRNVALLHDYDLYEFTIIVRK